MIAMIQALNPKKDYCKNQEFVPDTKYPHLHCGKGFLTYSVSGSNHDNLIDGDEIYCSRVTNVLDKIAALPNSQRKTEMRDIVTEVKSDWCVKNAVHMVQVDQQFLAEEESKQQTQAEM